MFELNFLFYLSPIICTISLISAARESGTEVVYIRHDDGAGHPLTKGSDDFEIFDGFKPLEGEKIFDKTVNSPFKDSGLLEYLHSINERELMVVGLQTDYCIDATVKCGFEHGFEMLVPANANTTFGNSFMSAESSYRYYNEFIWNGRYAQCISVEQAIEQMKK